MPEKSPGSGLPNLERKGARLLRSPLIRSNNLPQSGAREPVGGQNGLQDQPQGFVAEHLLNGQKDPDPEGARALPEERPFRSIVRRHESEKKVL